MLTILYGNKWVIKERLCCNKILNSKIRSKGNSYYHDSPALDHL